jgi:hypothetical protein
LTKIRGNDTLALQFSNKINKGIVMQRKQSEKEMGDMFRSMKANVRKSRDAGYVSCPTCHSAITFCPHCHKSMLLPKSEHLPDFVVSTEYIYVECKQGMKSWPVTDFSETQIEVMDNAAIPCYLFLLMSNGKNVRSGGRKAWLVPWKPWRNIQKEILESGFKSIAFEQNGNRTKSPIVSEILAAYELTWEKGKWRIPLNHCYWNIP